MKRKMTAIVVEDERLPRLSLLQKLEAFRNQIEVVDSCESYDDALYSITRNKPDVLFLDIQLQGRDALQLLDALKAAMPLPHVIFTTAYADRKYLMSAIKLSAVDYLLKPVDKGELAVAIAKLTKALPDELTMEADGKVTLRTAMGRMYVNMEEIAYIRANGNYVDVVLFDKQDTVLESLSELEKRLTPYHFVRTGRSTIINLRNLHRLNTKQRNCILMSDKGETVIVPLSQNGVRILSSIEK